MPSRSINIVVLIVLVGQMTLLGLIAIPASTPVHPPWRLQDRLVARIYAAAYRRWPFTEWSGPGRPRQTFRHQASGLAPAGRPADVAAAGHLAGASVGLDGRDSLPAGDSRSALGTGVGLSPLWQLGHRDSGGPIHLGWLAAPCLPVRRTQTGLSGLSDP